MMRALLIIDAMTFGVEESFVMEAKTPIEKFCSSVYCIAHAAHGKCCVDSSWLDQIDEQATLLKKANIMDLEKELQDIQDGKKPRERDPKGLLHAIEEASKK